MATREQRDALRNEVGSALTATVNLSPGDYERLELGEDLSFADVVSDVALIITPLQELAGRDLGRLSFQQLERIKKATTIVAERLEEIGSFDLATLQGPPMEARNQIAARVHEAPDQVLEFLSLPLALTSTQAGDLAAVASQSASFRDEIKQLVDDSQREMSQYRAEASTALTAIKTIAGEAGVSEHASYFDTASTNHADAADKWLKATATAGSVTLLAAIAFVVVSFVWSPATIPQAIQYGISKLIVLSVTTYATVWCGINFRASRHNELVNGHRRDALGTFRAFVEASDDAQIRDAILLQASQAVFSGRTTGYDSTEQPQPVTLPLLETIKKLTGDDPGSTAS